MAFYHNGPRIVTDDLVFYFHTGNYLSYPQSGTTITNLAGFPGETPFQRSGSITGTVPFVGAGGGSLDLDNTNSTYIDVNVAVSELGGGTSGSILLWWNGDIDIINERVAVRPFGSENNWEIRFTDGGSVIPSGSLICDFGGSTNATSSLTEWPSGSWFNVGFTWEYGTGTGQFTKIYVNGLLDNTGAEPSTSPSTYTGNLRFGQRISIGAFDSKWSVVQLYNRALTDDEVLTNFNALKDRFGV